jgi:N-acetylmuramic acid 6-phosphate (MurNAc-6-P) etherase
MMIDVKVTNKKLYLRACRIIAEVLNIQPAEAEIKIIKTINIRSSNQYKKKQSSIEEIIES